MEATNEAPGTEHANVRLSADACREPEPLCSHTHTPLGVRVRISDGGCCAISRPMPAKRLSSGREQHKQKKPGSKARFGSGNSSGGNITAEGASSSSELNSMGSPRATRASQPPPPGRKARAYTRHGALVDTTLKHKKKTLFRTPLRRQISTHSPSALLSLLHIAWVTSQSPCMVPASSFCWNVGFTVMPAEDKSDCAL